MEQLRKKRSAKVAFATTAAMNEDTLSTPGPSPSYSWSLQEADNPPTKQVPAVTTTTNAMDEDGRSTPDPSCWDLQSPRSPTIKDKKEEEIPATYKRDCAIAIAMTKETSICEPSSCNGDLQSLRKVFDKTDGAFAAASETDNIFEDDDDDDPPCSGISIDSLPLGSFIRTHENCIPFEVSLLVMQHVECTKLCLQHPDSHWCDLTNLFLDSNENDNLSFITNVLDLIDTPTTTRYIYLSAMLQVDDHTLQMIAATFPNLLLLHIQDGSLLTNKAMGMIANKFNLEHLYIRNCKLMTNVALMCLAAARPTLRTLCLIGSKNMKFNSFQRLIHIQKQLLCAYCTI
ncbi:uncharacterized protein LOC120837771 [Ixodes scapularis]|uniref:uncharacterized protein LOC120837771 n=1 Tax=Ixodes scapularis TaxID=6945 RepID=UPI001A9FC05C|nr:uncharacterized protein LOC120837771 [Ixodes scapularis]